jgi:two-component SAPR family response regulator
MELGLASMNAGKFRQSLAYYEEALTYWRQSNDSVREATILYNLGVLHHYLGEYERAATFYEEALSLAKRSGYQRMEAYTLCGIGDLYADLEAGDPAVEAYQQARKTARQIDNRLILLYADLAEANQSRIKGEFDRARNLLDSAEGYAMGSNSNYENGLLAIEKGKFDLTTGNIGESLEGLEKAAAVFERDGQLVEACRAHLHWAAAYFAAGEKEAALATLAKTFQITQKVESQQVIVSAAREAKELLAFAQTQPATNAGATRLLNQVGAYEQEIPSIRRRLRPNVTTVPFVHPKLFVRALGQSQIELDGKPVEAPEWQTQKRVRELFFFMLSNEKSLSKEEVGSILLPESSPGQLRMQFKNLVYRLRHALGQETISNVNERYMFNRDLDYKYDVEIFQRKIQEAQSELDMEKRVSALNEAISLYRGPYLADLEGTWMLPERQRLLELFLHALEESARIHLEAREYDRTLAAGDRILKADPCREEAYRLKMMAFAALGSRADIHRQYERCREVLAEEMNAEPSPQTEALYFKLTQ